jgi:predicted enzyme related to lactoylglutathione lyase
VTASNVCHFAIECDDVERAKRFYETVFGWKAMPWGPPGYYIVVTGTAEQPGIQGDLRGRSRPVGDGGGRGFECTITVSSLKEAIAAIEANGGRMVGAPYRIEGVGDLVYFEDTEGNRAGVMQHSPDLRLPEGVRL